MQLNEWMCGKLFGEQVCRKQNGFLSTLCKDIKDLVKKKSETFKNMQFTIPAYLFSTALPIKQFNSEKTTCGQYTHYENIFSTWTEAVPPPSSASLRPLSLAYSTDRFLPSHLKRFLSEVFQLNGHDIVAPYANYLPTIPVHCTNILSNLVVRVERNN